MNNGYVSEFLKAADEFKTTYGQIADNYMNNEISASENRERFVDRNNQTTTNTVSSIDANISDLEANNAKQDADIASHQATIEALRNGTHEALQGLSEEEKQIKADAMIQDYMSRIEMANSQKEENNKSIAAAEEEKNNELQRNSDYENEYDKAYQESEQNYREELVDSIKKFKGSFNEIELPDHTKVSNITMIKAEIQKKINEIAFNRAKAVAEMTILPQYDPRKGDYGRQLQALTDQLNGLNAFNNGLDSFLALSDRVEKKYVDGNRYPDVVEMQKTFEEMKEYINAIETNRVDFEKDVPTVIPSKNQTDVKAIEAPVQEEVKEVTPVVAPEQESTPAPVEEVTPEVTPEPKSTPAPVEEVTPVVTPEPEPTPVPEPEPIPVPEPEPTPVPEPEPIPAPEPKPTPAPVEEVEYSTDKPRFQNNAKYSNSKNAKAVINKRKGRNIAVTGASIAIGTLIAACSTSPLATITVPAGILYGAIAGGGLSAYADIVDRVRKGAFERKLNKIADKFDAEVVYDYKNQKAHFAALDKDGNYQIIKSKDEMFVRLFNRIMDENLRTNKYDSSLDASKELFNKYSRQFKKMSGGVEFDPGKLTDAYDKFGGVVEVPPLNERLNETRTNLIETGVNFVEKQKNRLESFLGMDNKYHLSPEQYEKIKADIQDEEDMIKRSKESRFKLPSLDSVKNAIVNNRVVNFIKDRNEDVEEDFYNEDFENEDTIDEEEIKDIKDVEEDLESQRSEDVKNIVEEQNLAEEYAPEVKETEEVPFSSADYQSVLNQYDLMNESESLQNDDVIDVKADMTNVNDAVVDNTTVNQYEKWINDSLNDPQFLDSLHVVIGEDANLTEDQKNALQDRINNIVNPSKENSEGRSL